MTTAQLKPAAQAMLDRLRVGQEWLIDAQAELMGMEHSGTGSALDRRFQDAIHLFDSLDHAVRYIYNFSGCIHGPRQRCPPESMVSCRGCVDV